MARKYTKRSDYWKQFGNNKPQQLGASNAKEEWEPALVGEPLIEETEVSIGSSDRSRLTSPHSRTRGRSNRATNSTVSDRFGNIEDGLLPYDYSSDSVGAKDAVVLCQKAYFNIAVFRTTIDLQSEFADSGVFLEEKSGTDKSRRFITSWFKKIGLDGLKEQYFREWYRSGNWVSFRLDADLMPMSARNFLESESATKGKYRIPVKYITLNPADLRAKGVFSFGDSNFAKVLTPFEVARLKAEETEEAAQVLEGLDADVRKQIKEGTSMIDSTITMDLDPKKIKAIFYKKQDYEPLSIPMGFSVLDDLNKKLELKKMDQAITRSIENVVLLITMGAEPDKGGINDKNIRAMQDIFTNKSVGRVLVSDWTTKADFVIPDLKKVLGKEKYEVLNKDIEQGLGNMLMGESKYADTEIKMRLFFQRLEEPRDEFLSLFLQPEIDRVCKDLGLKKPPIAKFKKFDTIDSADMQRLVTRMMELGILTPEQGMDVIDKGKFPTADQIGDGQEEYVKKREAGQYLPLVGGTSLVDEPAEGQPKKKSATTSGPSGGRPTGTGKPKAKASFAVSAIASVTKDIQAFQKDGEAAFREKFAIKRMSKQQRETAEKVCEAVIVGEEKGNWKQALDQILGDINLLAHSSVLDGVLQIGAEHGLDDYSSSILYHSQKIV